MDYQRPGDWTTEQYKAPWPHLLWWSLQGTHIEIISKKASQRLFALRLHKRSRVPMDRLINIYCSLIRPVMEYACQVWHGGLIGGQSDLLKSVQIRAMRIIMSDASYEHSLEISELCRLDQRWQDLCKKLFNEMQSETHRLHHLLPPVKTRDHAVREGKKYPLTKLKIGRTKKSFVNWCLFNLQ